MADSAGSIRASAAVTGSLYLPAIAGGAGAAATPDATPSLPTATAPVGAEEGGSLTAIIGALATTIDIPPGAIGEDATLVVQLAALPPLAGSPLIVGDMLDIQLRTETGGSITQFLKPFTMTIGYGAEDVTGVNAGLLALHYWDTAVDQWQEIPTTVDVGNSQLTAVLDHLTIFAVLEGLPPPTAVPPTAVPPTAVPTAAAYTIAGVVQKGPFVQGASITVRELDNSFTPTGRTFSGSIDDNTGRFSVRGTLAYPYVELEAHGYYFNEVAGALSIGPIRLLSVSDLRVSSTVNINPLTHLERSRWFNLVDGGLNFSAAKAQAQQEVLAAFNISGGAIANSESLDISQAGEGNAILLAISVILQANRSEAQLTELLSVLSNDLQADGLLNSATTRQSLVDGMEYVKPRRDAIRANVVARYAALGIVAAVPDFAAYAFALDTAAPSVAAPTAGTLYAQEVNTVTVVFNELMRHTSLSSGVRLSNSADQPVSGSLTISDSIQATSVVFTPNAKLALGLYQLAVADTAQDLAGNRLASTQVVNLTVVEEPIAGLTARSSATVLGEPTHFTATVGSGSNVIYTWSFGDGAIGSGPAVTHTYGTLDTYTAIVTATNSVSSVVTQTLVYNGWVLIPAGSFQMGCDSSNSAESCNGNEQPLHTVTLDAYYIDKYEVTNARYKACVDAGGCTAPGSVNSNTRSPYYGTGTYADYPVIHVDWDQASAFCAWAGKRLPTEAEWEKAARGGSDTRKYSWGNEAPDCGRLNYNYSCVGDTSRVGTYPSGASPYGVMDMAGNVWEWVNDWYSGHYYHVSPSVNPQGPETGTDRVLRGGSWYYSVSSVRSASRDYNLPVIWGVNVGFRCVRSP